MRRMITLSVALGMILAAVGVGPVSAGSRTAVTMTVATTFDGSPAAFTATGIPDCEWGSVYDAGGGAVFTRHHGVFAGYKAFDCEDGGENGFVVRLNARFGDSGSVGAWTVVGSWGSLSGLSGAGGLTGDPTEGGITDNYFGAVIL
jgi:hypothetical protein